MPKNKTQLETLRKKNKIKNSQQNTELISRLKLLLKQNKAN